jgi:pyruvate dehydrogenase E2 component (dihydrolipoamide acetyltransferase)
MARELKLQDPGEGIHEVEIREVLVAEGDTVSEGESVLVVESDKAAIEIPAPYSGTVQTIAVAEGDTATVGDVLMTFGKEGKADTEPEEAGSAEEEELAAEAAEPEGDEETAGEPPATEQPADGDSEPDKGEDRADERRATDQRAADEDAGKQAEEVVSASPLARRVAQQQDVDLEAVEPTGPHGRVLLEDVEQAAGATAGKRKRRSDDGDREALPDFARWGLVERQKLRSIRRATARRMARAWADIPHVTHQDVADVTDLEAFRRRHAAEVEAKGGKLTLTAFAMKAAVAALKEHPWFNASLDAEADEVVLKHYFHLGVAVDTPHGLLVPVIRDVDRKSLVDLAVELSETAERARSGRLDRKALQGGSFTITNVGPLGGTGFAPIVNHPEVAILGLARANWQAVVADDPVSGAAELRQDAAIVPRLLLPLCLAFDHRVVDGAAAARFTRRIAETLADVEAMTLVG